MKKVILLFMALTAMTNLQARADGNPLLSGRSGPHDTPLFEEIKLEHYMPAFEKAISRSRAEVDAIVGNPEPPTFENTIEALERQGKLLSHVATLFFVLNSSATSPEMEELANRVQPMLIELGNDISLNPALFERVKRVYEETYESYPYTPEQKMLLEKSYKGFTRSGAGLSPADQEKYRAVTAELGVLNLKFGQNVLAETNAFSINIPLSDAHKVDYMPDFVKEGMAAEASARGQEGWTVSLQAPSYIPFLTYSRERDIKEQLWRKYGSIGYGGGEYDNRENVKRISELRMQLANLLGYETYADYVLEERMAKSRPTVDTFLQELLDATYSWGCEEADEIARYAARLDGLEQMMPWDFGYYNERYKTERYDLNEEELKPYFQLEKVEDGVFTLAGRLFGITFKENPAIQVYHPDVKAFEVYDEDGSFLAVLYMDYFPRSSKRGGAWMTNFRDMYVDADGTEVRPLVTLNFNFTKPAGDMPSLLTFDEVVTFLHEFGHGLHGIFAEGTYGSLTGTAVYRDFVELPSQLLENWATEKEFLDLWAVHYQSGEAIPEELVKKIIDAKNYLAAYSNVRQLTYGMNDMAWHSLTAPYTGEVAAFEREATAATQILPLVDGICFSTAFRHVFAGGYAAGYYSYKWSEVLEADAFSLFQEKGIFNREVADSYRRNILSPGGTVHPLTLYVNFRGHEPSTQALIDKIAGERK